MLPEGRAARQALDGKERAKLAHVAADPLTLPAEHD